MPMYSEEIQTKHRHEPILEVLKIAMMLPLAIWWSIDQWPMNYAAWFSPPSCTRSC